MSITDRPDITTLCNKACKGMHNPKHSHILEHTLKYLKGTKTEGLCYRHNDSVISNLRAHLSRKYVEHQPSETFLSLFSQMLTLLIWLMKSYEVHLDTVSMFSTVLCHGAASVRR
mmetsp:Transcript_10796/g.32550  ORF Transcript_10796/g.32550 Transcript_10796/m.32550 type:complete len:115 (-) Transcript_10796:835-1179(-)